jgi:ADP-heptose:LPS heptosyltransferase
MVKFLVIRISSIGDIVLTTPVIRGLHQQVEGARVHFLTKKEYAGLLSANPYLDKVHVLDNNLPELVQQLKAESFDYIIDLQNNLRSSRIKSGLKRMYFTVNKLNLKKWLFVNFRINRLPSLHIVDRYLETVRVFDVQNDGNGLDHFIPANEEYAIRSLPETFHEGYIVLAIGAGHATKKMPSEKLVDVCNQLNHPTIIIGGSEDRVPADTVIQHSTKSDLLNLCGSLTVHGSASLIRQANCVITHDTGMMHIAAAFRKKIITVWGNTVPDFGMSPYMPDPASVSFGIDNLSCRPCSKLGYRRCPKSHFKCMNDHDAKAIAEQANALFILTGQ